MIHSIPPQKKSARRPKDADLPDVAALLAYPALYNPYLTHLAKWLWIIAKTPVVGRYNACAVDPVPGSIAMLVLRVLAQQYGVDVVKEKDVGKSNSMHSITLSAASSLAQVCAFEGREDTHGGRFRLERGWGNLRVLGDGGDVRVIIMVRVEHTASNASKGKKTRLDFAATAWEVNAATADVRLGTSLWVGPKTWVEVVTATKQQLREWRAEGGGAWLSKRLVEWLSEPTVAPVTRTRARVRAPDAAPTDAAVAVGEGVVLTAGATCESDKADY